MTVSIYVGSINLTADSFSNIKKELSDYDFFENNGSFVWYSKDGYIRLQLYRDGRFEMRKGASLLELNHHRIDISNISIDELLLLVRN